MATCKLVGLPCATYGPYTFYKAFKYTKNGKANILSLSEFFFVKLWSDSDLVSIGELTLLWEDRNSEQTLACLRLYILPENTPDGRNDIHGEDEVLSITEKVVLRLEDLLTWLTDDADWSWGLGAALWQGGGAKKTATPTSLNSLNACCASIDFSDVEREKEALGPDHWEKNPGVIVLSFTRYCRYRGLLRRFEGSSPGSWLSSDEVIALGGFHAAYKNTKVLFCKDTFDYPDLEGHELLCNHLAPKYKGRTKKRKKLLVTSVDSDSGSESSSTVSSSNNNNNNNNKSPNNKSGLRVRLNPSRKSPRISDSQHERDFLARLYQFMKTRKTPIGKVPTIGFKELDLYKLFHKVKHLGGYEEVTTGRLWKYVFAEVGGEQGTTSSGTLSRKHYERLLLPYEKHMGGGDKDAAGKGPAGKATPLKPGKVNGNVSIQQGRKEKESPVITLEESSNSSSNSNSNLTSCGNGSDKPSNFSIVKRKIVMEGNSSSLRNARLKLEKPEAQDTKPPSTPAAQELKPEVRTNGQVSPPRDKENIPLGNKPGEKRLAPPEVIDISEDSGPQGGINAFKKQKLDILKHQGLEVTPVSSEDVKPPIAHPPPSLPPAPLLHPPEFQQRERNKISITVTPDVSLLIKPQTSSPPPSASTHPPLPLPSRPPANLFTPSPYQPGSKPVYGNPKEVFSNPKEPPTYPSPKEQVYNNPKEILSIPKDIFSSLKVNYNKPKELFNSPKDLYSHPKDMFSSQKDLLNSSKEMYSNSKDLFSSQKELYHSPKNLFHSPKELYNNPPKELLYPNAKDIFNTSAGRDSFTKSKDNFSPISTKDSFNNANSLKDMFSPNNLKELLTNPGFRDMLGNPNFKDFFSNPSTLKDAMSLNQSPSKSSLAHFPPPPSHHYTSEDVLDLKVKPHPPLPATLSSSGHALKQRPPQQDQVLDLTVRGGKKEDLEITLLPSSHRPSPYEMKRPLPLPLAARTSPSPSLHKTNHSQHQQHNFKKNSSVTPPSSQSFASHSSPHNSHSSQHNSHSSQHNSHSSQHNSHSSQHNAQHNSHSSPHNSLSSLHSSQHNSHPRSKRKPSGASVPVPPTSRASSFASHNKPPSSPSPYMPMLDPMYFAALYSGLFPPNFMNPALFTPPVSAPSGTGAQDAALNIYKELLKAQNSSLFPNLFHDGGTSISLVGNNSKPSPK